VFPDQLPDGYLASMFEAWPQLRHLHECGRGKEEYLLPYVGQERHVETVPYSRPGAHGSAAGCPSITHITYRVGRGEKRRVVSPLGSIRREERILAVLPLDCPQSLDMAEAQAVAFCAGSGIAFLNNGPTANKRGMLDSRCGIDATSDVLLHQRIREWGIKGCMERFVADEPSYWLRRLLVPWEHKWLSGLHIGSPSTLANGTVGREDHDVGQSAAACVASSSSASGRYVILSSAALQVQEQHHQPSYLQVVESWRNPEPDGAEVYELCLWCSACNCPTAGFVCKHILTARIDYLCEGRPAVWSDSLLSPITLGRDKELGSMADVVTDLNASSCGDADTDNESDMDDDPSSGFLRPPRGILQLDARAMPVSFSAMLNAKPPPRPLPKIDVAIALDAIAADSVSIQGCASDMLARLESTRGGLRLADLTPAQIRIIEQCALAQRREQDRLEKLFAVFCGEPRVSQLGRGNMLQPLRSAAAGIQQEARYQRLGHPMYLPAVARSQAQGTLQQSTQQEVPRPTQFLAQPQPSAMTLTDASLSAIRYDVVHNAQSNSATAIFSSLKPPPPLHRNKRTRQVSSAGGGETLDAMFSSSSETDDDAMPAHVPVPSEASNGKRPRDASASASHKLQSQKLEKQKARWLARPRSFLWPAMQLVKEADSNKTMSQTHSGRYTCKCCEDARALWVDHAEYNPLHFMECGNSLCEDIASAIRTARKE